MSLRVGLIGSGFMGATHALGWGRTPAVLQGVFSSDTASARKLADQYSMKVYNSLDDMLSDVDVVDVCTPTDTHHEIVLKAAAAGRQIVCEKPLARTLPQARDMIEACKRAGVKLLVAHVVRFFPEYALAKKTVERGDIGQVAVIRLTRASFKPHAARAWFHDYERSGGMMLDLMIHDFDYARWVAGDVESVFAKNVRSRNPNANGDYSLAILRHVNGALSHVEGGWAYPPPLFRTALEIAGDRGLIEHPAGSSAPLGVYLQSAAPGEEPQIAVPRSPLAEDPYTTELKHFYQALVDEGVKLTVTAQDGLAALEIALAAIESARTGRRVLLKEVR